MTNKLKLTLILLCLLVCGCAEKYINTADRDTYNIKIITESKVIDVNATIAKGWKPSAYARENIVIYSGFDEGEIVVPANATCIIQRLIKVEDNKSAAIEPLKVTQGQYKSVQ